MPRNSRSAAALVRPLRVRDAGRGGGKGGMGCQGQVAAWTEGASSCMMVRRRPWHASAPARCAPRRSPHDAAPRPRVVSRARDTTPRAPRGAADPHLSAAALFSARKSGPGLVCALGWCSRHCIVTARQGRRWWRQGHSGSQACGASGPNQSCRGASQAPPQATTPARVWPSSRPRPAPPTLLGALRVLCQREPKHVAALHARGRKRGRPGLAQRRLCDERIGALPGSGGTGCGADGALRAVLGVNAASRLPG